HYLQLKREVATKNFLAKQTPLSGLLDRPPHAFYWHRILLANIDIANIRICGYAANDHPFDEKVRIALHQVSVDERSGVPFIGIADQVFRFALGIVQEFPLEARGEGCATTTPETRALHFLDDVERRHAE